jgi:hypothetical protein
MLLYESKGNNLCYKEHTPHLFGLPFEVRQRVYKQALGPSGSIVIDLDTGKLTGIDLALSMVKTPEHCLHQNSPGVLKKRI